MRSSTLRRRCDYVFTTDEECLERYRQQVPAHVPVKTLIMPFQPAFHSFTGFNFTRNEVCFTGSYYRRILNERRRFLDMVFELCEHNEMPINVFDRNHDRLSRHFEFRFPKTSQMRLHGKVPHRETVECLQVAHGFDQREFGHKFRNDVFAPLARNSSVRRDCGDEPESRRRSPFPRLLSRREYL